MAYGSSFGVLLAGDPKGLNPKEVTIAEVLKAAGYKTGMFGKWHLGDQPQFLPTRQGFDEFFGLPYSWDIHPTHPRNAKYHFPPLPLLDGERVVELDPDLDYLTTRITDRAVGFIEANKDRPFFLYLAEFLPHNPLHVSPPFMKDVPQAIKDKLAREDKEHALDDEEERNKLYPNAISEIDGSVGRVLDALKANGLDENTLVVFTSDNGPALRGNGSAKPLKGNKGETWEGGMRVPAVVRWPGHIPAGRVNGEQISSVDLLPTFAGLAGGQVPADRVIDGKDIWPVLTRDAKSPQEAFFYHRGNQLEAVRSGKWKLRMGGKKPALYDLEADIGETTNVLAQHPEIAERLRSYVKAFEEELAQNSRPAGVAENPKPLTK
jgi:arylsulfatase A-like enzyme